MIILVNLTLSRKALTANGNAAVHKSVVFYKGTQSALQKKKKREHTRLKIKCL